MDSPVTYCSRCRTQTRSAFISRHGTFQQDWSVFDGHASPYVPVLLVPVQRGLEPILLQMLVDTGADISVLPRDLLGALGLTSKDLVPERATGLTGSVATVRATKIQASIGTFTFSLPTVDFFKNANPILGRDALFGPFELRMFKGKTELRLRE